MNIKDLPQNSYKPVNSGALNIKNLPAGSYKTISGTPDPMTDPYAHIQNKVAQPQPKIGNFLSHALLDPLKAGVQDVKNIAGNVGKDVKNVFTDNYQGGGFSSGFQAGGNVAKAVLSPITSTISEGANAVGDKVSNIQQVKDLANSKIGNAITNVAGIPAEKFNEWATKHPEAAKNLGALGNLAQLGTAVGTAGSVANTAEEGLGATANAATKVAGKVGSILEKSPEDLAAQAAAKAEGLKTKALQDITPDYENATPTQKTKMVASGKVQEGTLTKGRTIAPSAADANAASELSKIPGYETAKTFLEKHNLAKEAFFNEAKNLETTLSSIKKVIPKQTMVRAVSDAIGKAADESLLLSKSDPVAQNFMRVVRNAADKVEGTLKGGLDLKKTITRAYQNARGGLAYTSDKIAPLDELNRAANTALRDFLIKNAPNEGVAAAFEKQFHLGQAFDGLLPKVVKEAGTGIGRFAQKHPLITKGAKSVGKTVSRAAGIGEAINILH